MKRTLLAICIGTLALAVGASAEDRQDQTAGNGNKGRRAAVAASHANTATNVRSSRQFSARQNATARSFRQPRTVRTQTSAQTAVAGSNNRAYRNVSRERGFRRAQETTGNTAVANATTNRRFARGQNIQQQRQFTADTNRNFAANRTRNINRNVTVVNNWRSSNFTGQRYSAFRNYQRSWHDRGWYRNHYGSDHLIFVSGGWYFWNSGYWYPAWGYDPGYYYPYDGPIYGYGALTPDQVVVNVQLQLRNDGYYTGAVDGVLGPQTRYALAAFQADQGLAVTSAVDEPTLATLGLV
jgi:hypothetical protein